ncbi:MAG TPA: hypothetical protein VHD88_08975, partial [Pyrinomonadaceae bacterium]|nr:hypothetical protein [Pyrinomonadaceae bacterium]
MMQQLESLFGQAKLQPFPFEGSDRPWRRGPASPVIWPNEVHVWKIDLSAQWSSENQETLSNDEKARAARFRFHLDTDRFIAARASMRIILARYLWTKPAELKFEVNPFGKPHLVGGQNKLGLRFNLSHSHEMALLAVARNRD